MTKRIRVNINLPFSGFYGSDYEAALDREAEQWVEWRATEDNGSDDDEARHPAELRLSEGELAEVLFNHTRWRPAYEQVAKWYVEAFNEIISDALDLDLGLTFEALISPRSYNFETDRVFADVDLKVMRELFRRSAAEDHRTLKQVIEERFTSRSGFSSFYRTDLGTWKAKPLRDWDHNELGTLLLAAMRMAGVGTRDDATDGWRWRDWEHEVFDRVADDDGFGQAWSAAVDWDALEIEREQRRADKLDALRDTDPELAATLAPTDGGLPCVRCPDTLDLFDNRPGA